MRQPKMNEWSEWISMILLMVLSIDSVNELKLNEQMNIEHISELHIGNMWTIRKTENMHSKLFLNNFSGIIMTSHATATTTTMTSVLNNSQKTSRRHSPIKRKLHIENIQKSPTNPRNVVELRIVVSIMMLQSLRLPAIEIETKIFVRSRSIEWDE